MWNPSHIISKFFLRLEDTLNGHDSRAVMFDIESRDFRRWDDQFDFPVLEATLVIDGHSYHIQAEAVDVVPEEVEAEEEEGGIRHVSVLCPD